MTNLEPTPSSQPPQRPVKLIFNPASGAQNESPAQLVSILNGLQSQGMIPEVHLVTPGSSITEVVQDALARGIKLFVASGGDGTVDSVGGCLMGTDAVLGIVPTGTRNNVAFSLKVPPAIPDAVALLANGRIVKVDMGVAEIGGKQQPFLEVCAVGLLSALFPTADEIQHGNFARIGEFVATLVNFPMAFMHLKFDGQRELNTSAHMVLVANMPFIGPRYPIGSERLVNDGTLEAFVFAHLTKLDLLGEVIQLNGSTLQDDERVYRYPISQIEITTDPAMPVLADGFPLGEGTVRIRAVPHSLAVITGLQEEPRN